MPTSVTLTAGQVMDASAALLNDVAKSIYTYVAQIPYLNIALGELQEYYELNNIPVTDSVSTVVEVFAGQSSIGFSPDMPVIDTPYLPDDLIEPKVLWERQHGIDPFTPMDKRDYLSRNMEGVEISQFLIYTWQSNEIRVFPANTNIDIKMDYIRSLFVDVTDEDDELAVINSKSFLIYRTAGLCAEFIGENKTRADELNNFASLSMDRSVGIGTKGRQAINIRHRPFRSSYKRRTYT